jgi:hypothetical protein
MARERWNMTSSCGTDEQLVFDDMLYSAALGVPTFLFTATLCTPTGEGVNVCELSMQDSPMTNRLVKRMRGRNLHTSLACCVLRRSFIE